jgi:hypothetical protein
MAAASPEKVKEQIKPEEAEKQVRCCATAVAAKVWLLQSRSNVQELACMLILHKP